MYLHVFTICWIRWYLNPINPTKNVLHVGSHPRIWELNRSKPQEFQKVMGFPVSLGIPRKTWPKWTGLIGVPDIDPNVWKLLFPISFLLPSALWAILKCAYARGFSRHRATFAKPGGGWVVFRERRKAWDCAIKREICCNLYHNGYIHNTYILLYIALLS